MINIPQKKVVQLRETLAKCHDSASALHQETREQINTFNDDPQRLVDNIYSYTKLLSDIAPDVVQNEDVQATLDTATKLTSELDLTTRTVRDSSSTRTNWQNLHTRFKELRNATQNTLVAALLQSPGELQNRIDILNQLQKQATADTLAIKKTLRDVSDGVVGLTYQGHFHKLSKNLQRSAILWLITLFALVAIGITIAIVSLSTWSIPLISDMQAAYATTARIFIASLLLIAIAVCGRNYRASKHLSVVNRHRQMALSMMRHFAKSAGDDIDLRRALHLHVLNLIFSHSASGYLTNKDQDEPTIAITQVLETLGAQKRSAK
ncbi:MAG: hypothetical protein KDC95_14420 [Planctomycetes bacterium]|nr:hypothetical protein [Planctomycetota bacterium]